MIILLILYHDDNDDHDDDRRRGFDPGSRSYHSQSSYTPSILTLTNPKRTDRQPQCPFWMLRYIVKMIYCQFFATLTVSLFVCLNVVFVCLLRELL